MANRNSKTHPDPVRELLDQKTKELSRRSRKSKSKSSAMGLDVAKIASQNKTIFEPVSGGESDQKSTSKPVPRSDPFGLNDVPKMKPTQRRN
jgi:hypothetical protein